MPGKTIGKPSMVVLSNNANEAAQLLIARVEADGVKTHIGSLPAETQTTLDDCGCDAAERGHAVTGKIVSVLTDRKALLVAHEEVPGVMMAMTMSFQVDPRVLDLVKPEQNILARMERRDDGKWWLFSIRILNAAN
jgi:Cu/Ag efflux protein CusF